MMILTQLDNMGSAILFYWLKLKFPVLTNKSNFLVQPFDRQTTRASNTCIIMNLITCISFIIPNIIIGEAFIEIGAAEFVIHKHNSVTMLIYIVVLLIMTCSVTCCYFKSNLKDQNQGTKS